LKVQLRCPQSIWNFRSINIFLSVQTLFIVVLLIHFSFVGFWKMLSRKVDENLKFISWCIIFIFSIGHRWSDVPKISTAISISKSRYYIHVQIFSEFIDRNISIIDYDNRLNVLNIICISNLTFFMDLVWVDKKVWAQSDWDHLYKKTSLNQSKGFLSLILSWIEYAEIAHWALTEMNVLLTRGPWHDNYMFNEKLTDLTLLNETLVRIHTYILVCFVEYVI